MQLIEHITMKKFFISLISAFAILSCQQEQLGLDNLQKFSASVEAAPLSAYTLADNSKQAARATPKGSLSLLCAGDTENSKQPEFYVEPRKLQNGNKV